MVHDQKLLPEMVSISRQQITDLKLELSALVIAAHELPPGLAKLARSEEQTIFQPTT